MLLTSAYGRAHATIHDSTFTVTATFGRPVSGVSVDDFYRGEDIASAFPSARFALAGSGRVWVLTASISDLVGGSVAFSFEFSADAATAIAPTPTGTRNGALNFTCVRAQCHPLPPVHLQLR